MRILDGEKQAPLHNMQLYLTEKAAREFVELLGLLLTNPEANGHEHLFSDGREISLSIITPSKLADLSKYPKGEQKMVGEK
jgi:hypothetical protein